MTKEEITEVEQILKAAVKKPALLETAFTHRSYLNEHPDYNNPSNERLEFLGDAVLQFLITNFLYQLLPKTPEGILTGIRAATVNTRSLAQESRALGFGKYLRLSKGEEESGGRDRDYILANTFEAVLGYLFLDHGIGLCGKYLERTLFIKIKDIVDNETYRDDKSTFQELAQEKKGLTPVYTVLAEWGPDHDKRFRVRVAVGTAACGEGEGSSKQRAEQNAAKDALEKWKKACIM